MRKFLPCSGLSDHFLSAAFQQKAFFAKLNMYMEKPTEETERCFVFARKKIYYLILFYSR